VALLLLLPIRCCHLHVSLLWFDAHHALALARALRRCNATLEFDDQWQPAAPHRRAVTGGSNR
jgi:hypothetical protein